MQERLSIFVNFDYVFLAILSVHTLVVWIYLFMIFVLSFPFYEFIYSIITILSYEIEFHVYDMQERFYNFVKFDNPCVAIFSVHTIRCGLISLWFLCFHSLFINSKGSTINFT